MASFIEMPPPSRDIVLCKIDVDGRPARRMALKHNTFAACHWQRHKRLFLYQYTDQL